MDIVGLAGTRAPCVTNVVLLNLQEYVPNARRLHIVAGNCSTMKHSGKQIFCHHEDSILEGVTASFVRQLAIEYWGEKRSTAQFMGRNVPQWYFQQFLKLGVGLSLTLTRRFLIWDMDMIPLNPLHLLDKYDRIVLDVGGNVVPTYEAAHKVLFQLPLRYATYRSSLVTHHMVLERDVVRSFLTKVTGIPPQSDRDWVQGIMHAIQPRHATLGFSEYASYASFALHHFPDRYTLAERRTWTRYPFEGWTGRMILRALMPCCPSQWLMDLHAWAGYTFMGYETGHLAVSCTT